MSSNIPDNICQGCGSKISHPFFRGEDMMQGLPGEYQLWQCQGCGSVFLSPQPDDLERFYPSDYRPYNVGTQNNNFFAKKLFIYGLAKQANLVYEMTGLKKGSVLDVGCAKGHFLWQLLTRGWNVTGQELNPAIANEGHNLHGINIVSGDFQSVELPIETYDLITFWDVLEHLPEPRKALQKAWQLTRPGGWMIFSLPNPDSWEAAFFGPAWAGWDIPRHLWIFKPNVIKGMLAKEGWELEGIRWRRGRHFLFSLSVSFWIEKNRPNRFVGKLLQRIVDSWFGKIILWPYFQIIEAIGKGSIMIFAARRISDKN